MNNILNSYLGKRLQSFKCAFKGFARFYVSQVNAKIHVISALLAVIAGLILNISICEWCLVIISIGSVFTAEMFNTSIELITNALYPGHDTNAAKIKDIAAGAVLITAFSALVTGFLIFIPAIINLKFQY